MTIASLIARFKRDPACVISSPAGIPRLADGDILPDDVREFYTLCGGLLIGQGLYFDVRIVTPTEFTSANEVMLTDDFVELVRREQPEDRSWHWYIIADCGNGDFISLDCSRERNGRCYDSMHETHGMKGDMPCVSRSFTELLMQLYSHMGQHWYWLQPDFISLGDAYDE